MNPFCGPPEPPGPVVYLDLPGGNYVRIRLRRKVSRREFGQIKAIFELSEIAFVEPPRTAAVAAEARKHGTPQEGHSPGISSSQG
jgi:hypothetical protein